MVANPSMISHVTYAEFVAREETSLTKHEWLNGVVYDMAGGTPTHARLVATVTGILYRQLAGRRCTAYSSDLQIRVTATGLATYPDASVICGSIIPDVENKNASTNPRVLVEVLSDSTEEYDRGEKFAHYRRIPTLMEYVLVSQKEPCIEVFRRTSSGDWNVEKALAGQTIDLRSIECALDVNEVYSDPLANEQPVELSSRAPES